MTTEQVLFLLRVVSGSCLILILFALLFVLWRDYNSAAAQVQASRRVYGKLIAMAQVDEGFIPTGETYPLLPLTSLGRSPTNSVVLTDTFASNEHALVTLRNGQWWLEDRKSRNGTLLNSELITMPLIVTNSDIISIGNISFRIELEL